MLPSIILAILIVVVLFWVAAIYNQLVTLRNRFKNAFAQIDVQLRRRYDLIPNLVEAAKAYLQHERETLEAVIAARNQASNAAKEAAKKPEDAGAIRGLIGAEALLGGAMGRLMAVVERYPELKADGTIQQLMEELQSTENRVAFARQAYNDSVMRYNTSCQVFPNVFVANSLNFREAAPFEVEEEEVKEAPKVSFQ